MKKALFFAGMIVLIMGACRKSSPIDKPEPTHPVMQYKDLQNAEVKNGKFVTVDLDDDHYTDFSFGVLLVGDPLLQRDRLQFYVGSNEDRNLLNNENDESPMLNRLELVKSHHTGYTWYEISFIVLAEKITTTSSTYWQGIWKDANHKYLPLQLNKNDKIYNGWIELSFDSAAQKLVLHKAAFSTEENKEVKAGY